MEGVLVLLEVDGEVSVRGAQGDALKPARHGFPAGSNA